MFSNSSFLPASSDQAAMFRVYLLLAVCLVDMIRVGSYQLQATRSRLQQKQRLFGTAEELATAKAELLSCLDGSLSGTTSTLFACPESLSPLTRYQRFFGPFVEEKFFENKQFGTKYPILPGYIDFTIKKNIDKPIWQLTNKERIGQNTFQQPLMSFIYERGYRQQFEVRDTERCV